jgi:hypothetical protein
MSLLIQSAISSGLYQQQIGNISTCMQGLAAQALLYPLQSMTAFNKIRKHFLEVEDEAYLCCSVMDKARSIENEDRATHATFVLMAELIHLKNSASALIKNEPNETLLFRRS